MTFLGSRFLVVAITATFGKHFLIGIVNSGSIIILGGPKRILRANIIHVLGHDVDGLQFDSKLVDTVSNVLFRVVY